MAGIMAYRSFLAMEEQKNAPESSAEDTSKASGDFAASDSPAGSKNGSQKGSIGSENNSGSFQRPETLLDKLQRIVRRARTG